MATILQESPFNQNQTEKNLYNSTEMITLVIGFMMMIMALGGLLDPTFLGLSLSPMHCFVLGGSGALAVWSGLFRDQDENRAYQINLVLGLFFLANAVAGVLLEGAFLERTAINESLVRRIAPGFLDLKLGDHIMHLFAGIWFLIDAMMWRKQIRNPIRRH